MRCGFCQRIKNLRKIDIVLILLICFFMYIANQFQMREYYAQKAKVESQRAKVQDKKLEEFENLQRECLFKQDKTACEALKKY
ncbi:hypothetical protein OQH61_01395 [Helicobacter sp. MIT 21-1697]|uniref:hypothetical protein n=1 Tax=Helicobacter sp. MIT 21-1697 TaxID=2993733 RepID=UPI00224AB9D5|nr:hypothetical protein [Helicobacter sp. MIT 21-1697]MCX2716394.1 hypothetical protein [Helicobacter sp. MIT 21-1697]